MAVPIELEIFMRDLTKAGLQSVSNNVQDVEAQTRQLIAALNQVIAAQKNQLEANKSAGLSYTKEAANIQALTAQVKGLREGLEELKKAQEDTASNPPSLDIDTDAVTRKTNNLKLQFAQVARELPSLALGPQMFILAISNNIPMLMQAISDVREQNELLAASGQKAVPVWKQLAGALFSWQTGLITAITLMIAFNKQISEFTAKLFKGKEAALSLSDAQKNISEEFSKSSGDLGEQIVRIRTLSERWNELGEDLSAKKKFIRENREELDKIPVSISNITEAENLLGQGTDAYIQAMSLRAQAAIAFKKASEEAVKSQEVQMKIDKEKNSGPSFWDKVLAAMASTSSGTYYSSRASTPVSSQEIQNERIKSLEEEKSAAEETEKAYRDLFKTLSDEAKKTLDNAGISGKTTDDKTGSRRDYASELADARVRAQQTTERLRLQLMQEGKAKRMALVRQEMDETLAEIDRAERETREKMDQARKQGDNIPQSQYDELSQKSAEQRALAEQVYNKKIQDIDQEYYDSARQKLIDYYKEYGNYQEKRLAIAQDYALKIAAAETEGERKSLVEKRDSAIRQLDFDQFKGTIDWEKIFGDLDRISTETLSSLRDKLKQYLSGIGDEISPESYKEVMDALRDIESQMADRSPFETLQAGYKDYLSAMDEVRSAQNLLNQAQMGGSVIVEEYDDATGTLTRKLITQAEAEEMLSQAQDKRSKAQKTLTDSVNSIGQKGQAVVNAGNDIVDMLTSLGVEVPEAVSGVLQGMSTVMDSLAEINLNNPFSALTGITGILKGLGQTIGSLFGIGSNSTAQYEALKNTLEAINETYDKIISVEKEGISFGGGFASITAASSALDSLNKQMENYRKLAESAGRAGSGLFKHSYAYRSNKAIGADGFREVSSLLEQNIDSVEDLYSLSGQQLYEIMSKLPEVWGQIDENIRQYLEQIADAKDETQEITDMLNEALTGVTGESFYNDFIDGLADMSNSWQDMCDDFETQLRKSILAGLVSSEYKERIQELYNRWAEAAKSDNSITEKEAEDLRQEYQQIVQDLMKQREEMADAFGWTSSGSSQQSPGSGALTTMSQDSISTFEGIGRNMQTHLANMDKHVQEIRESQRMDSETLATIASHTAYLVQIYEIMDDMRLNGITVK